MVYVFFKKSYKISYLVIIFLRMAIIFSHRRIVHRKIIDINNYIIYNKLNVKNTYYQTINFKLAG